jgi:hypothetical protein
VLLTRAPLPLRSVRLACVRPAASVRSEPGSNSQVRLQIIPAEARTTLLVERSTPIRRPRLHLTHLSHPRRSGSHRHDAHDSTSVRDTAPACLCPSPKDQTAGRVSLLQCFSLVQDPSLFTRVSPAPEPHPPVAPSPSRAGPPGRNVDVILPTFQCNQIFIFCTVRPAVSLSLAAVSSFGEAVYRGVAGACQTLCDENFSNSVFSPRGAFPRKAERLQTPPDRVLSHDPTFPRWIGARTRARAWG